MRPNCDNLLHFRVIFLKKIIKKSACTFIKNMAGADIKSTWEKTLEHGAGSLMLVL